MTKKAASLFVLVMLCVLNPLFSQSARTLSPSPKPEDVGISSERLQRLDKLMAEYLAKNWIPGAVVLIARKGKVVHLKTYGYSNIDNKTLLRKDDIFRLASQTKAVTSLAAMMLWEEGKFSLDDPVSKYITEFKNPTVLKSFNDKDSSYTTEPAKSEVTIRQLLTHTSGIDYPAIGSDELKAIYSKAGIPAGIGTNIGTLGDKMKALGKLPLKHQPGERWTYGLNSDLLGYLIEIWSGMTLDEFFRKRIFDPLGMKDTYFYLPPEKSNRLVALHTDNKGKVEVLKSTAFENIGPDYPNSKGGYYSGGAGLSGPIEDYAKFLQLFLNKGEYNGVRLLSRKTVELMLTPQDVKQGPAFGLGFAIETQENDQLSPSSIGSFSWGGAFNTLYWADPKENLIGLMYTNVFDLNTQNVGDKFRTLTYQSIAD
jgi:CubicO group peptidase (beta-lactamase class C family)